MPIHLNSYGVTMKALCTSAILTVAMLTPSVGQALSAEAIPLAQVSHIHGVGFDAAVPGSIFLATHFGLFRASPDGTAIPLSNDRNDYMGFTADPAHADRLFASGHPEGGGNMGVIVSSDGGATWTQIATGVGGPVDFHAMTVSRADPKTLYGLHGGIQVSRDGGLTWSVAGPGPDQAIDLAASPSQKDTLYAATVSGLMLSSDAGVTFQAVGYTNVAATMVESTADGSVYTFLAGAGLFRLPQGDGEWAALADDFGDSYILHLAADLSDPAHLVAITDKSEILESKDGGAIWAAFGS